MYNPTQYVFTQYFTALDTSCPDWLGQFPGSGSISRQKAKRSVASWPSELIQVVDRAQIPAELGLRSLSFWLSDGDHHFRIHL